MITSIIPIILMNLFSYYNTTGIVRDNITEMTEYNLEQTQSSVNTNVESYRDLLYQIYSDDGGCGKGFISGHNHQGSKPFFKKYS